MATDAVSGREFVESGITARDFKLKSNPATTMTLRNWQSLSLAHREEPMWDEMKGAGGSAAQVLAVGTPAPDFELNASPTSTIKLRELRGRPVILAFYPGDFSPVCGDQMALYNAVLPEFRKYGAELLGISVDSRWCHSAFVDQANIRFSLLADFEPKGEVGRRYGAYRDQDGTEERALFVIDRDGVIQWSFLSPIDLNPGADGILDALDALRAREENRHSLDAPELDRKTALGGAL